MNRDSVIEAHERMAEMAKRGVSVETLWNLYREFVKESGIIRPSAVRFIQWLEGIRKSNTEN